MSVRELELSAEIARLRTENETLTVEVKRLKLGTAHAGSCEENLAPFVAVVLAAKHLVTVHRAGDGEAYVVHEQLQHRGRTLCSMCEALADPAVQTKMKEVR